MTVPLPNEFARCSWGVSDPLMRLYHDTEWGVPKHDDRRLFEDLVLDGAQAGLNWMMILRKRENYRKAFDNFDAAIMARYGERKIQSLLNDPGIVRNRLKIASAITNARATLKILDQFDSFDSYIWRFTAGKTIVNGRRSWKETPARSIESDAMSTDLRQRGFTFVGSTICYAFMQATGMVNDHELRCFRHAQLQRSR